MTDMGTDDAAQLRVRMTEDRTNATAAPAMKTAADERETTRTFASSYAMGAAAQRAHAAGPRGGLSLLCAQATRETERRLLLSAGLHGGSG